MCNILLCHLSPVGNKAPSHINCEGGPVIHPVIRPCWKTLPVEGGVEGGCWGARGCAGVPQQGLGAGGVGKRPPWSPPGSHSGKPPKPFTGTPGTPQRNPLGSLLWDPSVGCIPQPSSSPSPPGHTQSPAHTLRVSMGHSSVCRTLPRLLQAATCMKVN